MHDRRKYLLIRWVLYLILLYLTFLPLFYTKNIDERIFFSTISLLILPLCLEYHKGLATFNKVSFWTRRIGFVVTTFYVVMCFVALSGGISIVYNETDLIASIHFLIGPNISIWFFKILLIFIPVLTFFDFIFTLSSQELDKYKVQDEVNEMLSRKMQSTSREQAVNDKMKEILEEVNEGVEMEGVGK